MSVARRIAFGVAAQWANRLVAVFLALALIPVLFDRLPRAELGVWFLLAQVGAFAGLLDFGFNVTLTRRIALAHARAEASQDAAAEEELRDLVATGRVLYRWIFAAVLVLGLAAGALLLRGLDLGDVPFERAVLAYAVLCLSYALLTAAGAWHNLLAGTGHVGWDAALGSAVTVATTLAQIGVAWAGGGLVALAVVAACGALASLLAARALARRKAADLVGPAAARDGRYRRDLVRDMGPLALRSWITAVGGLLILKTDQYFIAYFEGAAQIPAYHAAYTVVMNCYQLAVAFAAASSVYVSRLWSVGDLAGVHRLVWRSVRLGLGLMVCAVAFLLVCGPELFALWLGGSPGEADRFVGMRVLATFCAVATLEAQHVILAHSCRALDVEAFAPWAIAAGVLNLALSWALVGPLGLWGIALATLVAQLLTNNWYAVWRSLRELRMPWGEYVVRALVPLGGLAAVAALACWGLSETGRAAAGPAGSVAAGAVAAGLSLLLFWWFVAFDASERRGALALVTRRARETGTAP